MASTIWKGRLNFGLVSIPIRLSRAARAEKIHMHKLERKSGSRVRQVFVPKKEEEEPEEETASTDRSHSHATASHAAEPSAAVVAKKGLAKDDIVQGFEYEKGRYVKFEDEELAAVAPTSSPDMAIVEFVKAEEIDPVYLETSYYVAPDKGGEKPYALLFQAMKKSEYAAIGEFVMHRRDQILVMRPGKHGIIGHTLFYEDEVRRENEYKTDAKLVAGKEMDLAMKLVDALTGKFEPEKFKDKYRERLKAAIAQKVEHGSVTQAAEEEPAAKGKVVDIMAALQESLKKSRKPASSAGHTAGKKGKRAS